MAVFPLRRERSTSGFREIGDSVSAQWDGPWQLSVFGEMSQPVAWFSPTRPRPSANLKELDCGGTRVTHAQLTSASRPSSIRELQACVDRPAQPPSRPEASAPKLAVLLGPASGTRDVKLGKYAVGARPLVVFCQAL